MMRLSKVVLCIAACLVPLAAFGLGFALHATLMRSADAVDHDVIAADSTAIPDNSGRLANTLSVHSSTIENAPVAGAAERTGGTINAYDNDGFGHIVVEAPQEPIGWTLVPLSTFAFSRPDQIDVYRAKSECRRNVRNTDAGPDAECLPVYFIPGP